MSEQMTRDEMENGTEWLHVYPQAQWHDDASIVGTRKGIESLRDALTRALESERGTAMAEGFVTDGEGYIVNVYVVPFAEMERMQLPYSDSDMFNPNGVKGRMWPCHLPKQPTPEGER
jgi:hypothetical protein